MSNSNYMRAFVAWFLPYAKERANVIRLHKERPRDKFDTGTLYANHAPSVAEYDKELARLMMSAHEAILAVDAYIIDKTDPTKS